MAMFWRYLHGWDPGRATFMIANPFGALASSWVMGLLTMVLLVSPAVDIARGLHRRWRARAPGP